MTTVSAILAILALAQRPASPDPGPVPVAGMVVDATGRPVAGADVWLAEAVPPAEDRRAGPGIVDDVPAGPIAGEAPALAHARCDADGRYTLAIPAEVVARPSPPSLAIWAASPGPAPRFAGHRLPRVPRPDDSPARIALGPPAHIEIRILTPDRRPAAGARTIPARAGGMLVPGALARALAATADADGRATIARPATGAVDEVRVETDGYGTQIVDMRAPHDGPAREGRGGVAGVGARRAEPSVTSPHLGASPAAPARPQPPAVRTPDRKHPGGPSDEPISLVLAPVGRVHGRLAAPHGEPIRGATVRVRSRVGGFDGSGQGGIARVDCDEQGRFEIPAIAAGMMELEIAFDPERGSTMRPWPLGRILVRAGRTTELTIPVHPTVTVRGLVRERGTGRPIAGAGVIGSTFPFHGASLAATDASGVFRSFIAREDIIATPSAIRPPAPFLVPVDRADGNEDLPPRGVDEQTLRPIDLSRGVEVVGTVVDRRGEPVAGAEVEAIRPTDPPLVRSSRAGAAGRFVLHGIDPRAELIVRAWDGLAGSPAASFTPDALDEGPITLTLGPGPTTPIGGRVVDPDEKPIAGAMVRLWRKVVLKSQVGPILIDPLVQADGTTVLHTDVRGRFRTSRRFPADCTYVAEASAPGRLRARSPDFTPGSGAGGLPPIALRRLRTIEGRVVDRQGRPIAGALVFQSGDGPMRTETTSGPDGHFALSGFPEGPGLVFGRNDGYRPASAACDVPSGDAAPTAVTVALTRVEEAPAVAYKTLPPPLPDEEEKALSRRLIRPEADRILARGEHREKYLFLYYLAAFDPEGALEQLNAAGLNPIEAATIRTIAAGSLAAEDLDEALATVESFATAEDRARGYLSLIQSRPDLGPERARPLLDQAIVNARAAAGEYMRIELMVQLGRRLIERGEVKRARALIREGEDLARKTYRGDTLSWRLAYFAGLLLLDDPGAALPAFEELTRQAQGGKVTVRAFAFDRRYGQAAHHFAARDPAAAERLLRRVSFTLVRPANTYVVAVCARMATADLPRARKLLDLITEDERALKAYALGLMAEAIASDRGAALGLLDDAYAELEGLADRGWTSQYASISGVAGRLLPIVERVDASRLPEVMARALALRPPAGGRNDHAYFPEQAAELAIGVARYDRDLAARILQPDLDSLEAAPNPSAALSFAVRTGESVARPLAALALIDPHRAVALTEKLADHEGTRAVEGEARLRVAGVLALHGDARRRYIHERELNLWDSLKGVD